MTQPPDSKPADDEDAEKTEAQPDSEEYALSETSNDASDAPAVSEFHLIEEPAPEAKNLTEIKSDDASMDGLTEPSLQTDDPTTNQDSIPQIEGAAASLGNLFDEDMPSLSRDASNGISRSSAPPTHDKQYLLLVFLLFYSVTITIAFLLFYFRMRGAGSGSLESLPDVPPMPPGKVQVYRMDAPLPAGHVLSLGDSVCFGDILVEPLRITRGPVSFEHFTGDSSRTRPATADVLKLWVKLTNLSEQRAIAPLSRELIFWREPTQTGDLAANNFVAPEYDARRAVFLFDQPPLNEFLISGVTTDRPLSPGESVVTFLPTTEEGWRELKGPIVWRFHLRKGYSPSGNGVTTLVEVRFNTSEIQPDPQGAA